MNWPWRHRIRVGDDVLRCPECSSRHYLVSAKVRTDARRNGIHLTFETGNVCQCLNPKCKYLFATTDDGVIRLNQPQAPVTNATTEPTDTTHKKQPMTKTQDWTPRARRAEV